MKVRNYVHLLRHTPNGGHGSATSDLNGPVLASCLGSGEMRKLNSALGFMRLKVIHWRRR